MIDTGFVRLRSGLIVHKKLKLVRYKHPGRGFPDPSCIAGCRFDLVSLFVPDMVVHFGP